MLLHCDVCRADIDNSHLVQSVQLLQRDCTGLDDDKTDLQLAEFTDLVFLCL